MAADTVGQIDIRGENIDRAVKGFALQTYKFKSICLVQSSNNWTETYYKETAADLSAAGSRSVEHISRLSKFPYGEVSWEKTSVQLRKYGMEGVVSWEDQKTNQIDVVTRETLRIGRAIAKAVDDAIYSAITNDSTIQTGAAVATWDATTASSRDPIRDILTGIQKIEEQHYDVSSAVMLLSPHDYTSLMMNSKVINNPSFKTADVVSNGKVGQIAGLTIIKSTSVPADEALVIKGQKAATWKSVQDLTTEVIYDKLVRYRIRAVEVGVTQIRNPRAIVRLTGMDA